MRAAKWLDRESLYTVDWLPADVGLVEKIREGDEVKIRKFVGAKSMSKKEMC